MVSAHEHCGELAAVGDQHLHRTAAAPGADRLHALHHVHARGHAAEDNVRTVQVRRLGQ